MKRLTNSALLLSAFVLTASPIQAEEVYLCAQEVDKTMPDGTTVPMWGYALGNAGGCAASTATVPGPTITVPPGDSTLIVHLRNDLAGNYSNLPTGDANISFLIPSQDLPSATLGGAPMAPEFLPTDTSRVYSFVTSVAPGDSQDYTWNNIRPGTYAYHSGTHSALQVQMGLYGAMLHDNAAGEAYSGITYDSEALLQFSEVDPALHTAVDNNAYGSGQATSSTINYQPMYHMINGMPYDETSTLPIPAGSAGDNILLRMINMGLQTHAPTVLGAHVNVVAEAGHAYPYGRQQYSVNLAAGQTRDALLSVDAATTLPLFDRRLNLTDAGTEPGGMVAKLEIGAGGGGSGPLYYLSFNAANQTISGIGIQRRDVVTYDPSGPTWAMYFDGSDVLGSNYNIDAVHVMDNGDLVMSFANATATVPGIGTVQDEDLVLFSPTSTGTSTAGTFSLYLDGSTVGLGDTNGEDIDALSIDNNGELMISTVGGVNVPGPAGVNVSAGDEDALLFNPVSGTWSLIFDGSDVGATGNANDLDAVHHIASDRMLFSINGTSGVVSLADIAEFSGTFGPNTSGSKAVLGTLVDNIRALSMKGGSVFANNSPVAANDDYSMAAGGNLAVPAAGVLGNDSDADGDAMFAELVNDVSSGTLSLNSDGSFNYSPDGGFTGTDSFIYRTLDSRGYASANATVTIDVQPATAPNEPPTAVTDRVSTGQNTAIVINVVANDTDSDGIINPASVDIVVDPRRGGTVVNNGNGTVTFTPRSGFLGTDVFRYTVEDNDGAVSNRASVRVNVR